VEKLFRLMVFNVCIGNRDDHAKNFSFQLQDDRWTNSPAYDLLPSYGFNGQHTTTINGKGHPERADLLSCGKRAGLDLDVMNSIIDQVAQTCVQAKMFHRDLRC
jgi:serine/threonine-protein kinase HipA